MRITANQVTFARLALIPIPAWLLYQGVKGQYIALAVATILGCTDFIDGYLARKHGSTVLGSLMDPIADKVFTAALFVPAIDLGWLPAWMVAALFVREFFVTAARSVCERQGVQLKSPYLARYKTWVQMCGIAVLFLLAVASEATMDVVFAILAISPVVFFVIRYITTRKAWKGAAFFAVSLTGFWIVHRSFGSHGTALFLGWFILGITWASGFGYLVSVSRLLARDRTVGDIVRLVTSVAVPILAIWLQTTGAPSWPLIAVASLEMAHGGLDNLLAHHHAEASATSWGLRMLAECALLLVGIFVPSFAAAAAIGAFAVATVGLAAAFVQKRRYYREPQFANEAANQLRPTTAPDPSVT